MYSIEMKDICKKFQDFTASDHISLTVSKGELTALLGPSGSGKTTILRLIAGLETADSGEIYINGRLVNHEPPSARGIGFVFQNYALFRYMTVFENIAFGLKVKKLPAKKVRERVEELLSLTGLSDLRNRYPDELSGGQKQRVAFARALAPDPEVLLLDEPFAAIDAKVRKELRQWLREMIHQVGITSIFVTHDQDEASEVADRILVVNEGRIEQAGTAGEIYKKPATAFVAGFIGDPITIDSFARIPGLEQARGKKVMLRPEFVDAFQGDNPHFKRLLPCTCEGTIKAIRSRGNYLEVQLDVQGMTLYTHRSLERRKVSPGDPMRVMIYRLFLVEGSEVTLLKNDAIDYSSEGKDQTEIFQYSDTGYYVP